MPPFRDSETVNPVVTSAGSLGSLTPEASWAECSVSTVRRLEVLPLQLGLVHHHRTPNGSPEGSLPFSTV